MKIKNKKAVMSAAFIVGTMITVLAFVMIGWSVKSWAAGVEKKEAEILCHNSVALRAATAVSVGGEEFRTVPILCKTIDKKIKGNREEIKKQFADSMARCWWMFNEGRYKKNIFDNLAIMGGDKRCFMCYTLLVEESDDFGEGDRITAGEFKDFLMDEKHPKLGNWSYLSYFQEYGGEGQVLGILSEEGIAPNRAYAVGYKAKASKCSWCEYISVGGGGAAAAGLILLAVPGGQLVGAGLIVAGATASIASGVQMLEEEFFDEVDMDTIYLVDIKDSYLNKLFEKTCEKVEEDTGGK